MQQKSKILILGASGMLGNALLRFFVHAGRYTALGAVRSMRARNLLPAALHENIVCASDAQDPDGLLQLLARTRPDAVVNCIGLVKQFSESEDPLAAIPINSLLPHRLLRLCRLTGTRLVQISTDCVFAGTKGMYTEEDPPDAVDVYGRSKLLGEVDGPGAVTLRTSVVGPELDSAHGLLCWFLSQKQRVRGFKRAIFSGLTTLELARVIHDHVLPRAEVQGIYHVSAEPISKYDLLRLFAEVYEFPIVIDADHKMIVDRSLDSTRFRTLTGYQPPAWPQLVRSMRAFG
jgi:dTDP-4-dehydrorhamnose reductase